MRTSTKLTLAFLPILITVFWFLAIQNDNPKITAATIEPLFTGLGFVAVLATLALDDQKVANRENEYQQQIILRDREHHELLLKMQVQIKATCHAARIAALTTSLADDRTELGQIRLQGVSNASGSGAIISDRRSELESRIKTTGAALRKATEITEFL